MLRDLNYSKKLEDRLEFIQDMIALGERQAKDFLKDLNACRKHSYHICNLLSFSAVILRVFFLQCWMI